VKLTLMLEICGRYFGEPTSGTKASTSDRQSSLYLSLGPKKVAISPKLKFIIMFLINIATSMNFGLLLLKLPVLPWPWYIPGIPLVEPSCWLICQSSREGQTE